MCNGKKRSSATRKGEKLEMVTRIVNLKKEPYDVRIGRGSRLGNKYKIGRDGTRLEVIAEYRVDFEWKLENELGFKEYVESLQGLTLGCYCKPLACHGDVIKEYLDGE